MVEFQVSKGGATVNLTAAQTQRLQQLLTTDKARRGDTIVFFGEDTAIKRAGGFILAQQGAKRFISARSSAQAFRRGVETGAIPKSQIPKVKERGVIARRPGVQIPQEQAAVVSRRPTTQVTQRVLPPRQQEVTLREVTTEPSRFQRFRQRVKEVDELETRRRQFETETSFRELFGRGDLVSVVGKAKGKFGVGFLKTGEFVRTKVLRGEPLREKTIQRVGGQIGDVALFVAVSPFTQTTTQLSKSIAAQLPKLERTRIIFKGVTQKIDKGVLQTDISFVTGRREGELPGIARGLTGITKREGRKIVTETIVAGKRTAGRGLGIPQGKLTIEEPIFGIEKASIRTFGKISLQLSGGKAGTLVRGKEVIQPFLGSAVTRTGRGVTFIRAGAATPKGFVESAGFLFKGLPKTVSLQLNKITQLILSTTTKRALARSIPIETTKQITPSGTQQLIKNILATPQISKTAVASVRNIVGASVKAGIVQPSTKVITPPLVAGTVAITKTIQLPKAVQVSRQLPKQVQDPIKVIDVQPQAQPQLTGLFTGAATRLGAGQKQELGQVIKTPQLVKQEPIQKQPLIQKPVLSIPQITRQATRGFGIFQVPRLPTPKVPEKPFVLFKLPTARQPRRPTGVFPVELRRFGEFRVVGVGRTPREAIAIGRQRAATTLGATFRIPKLKQVPGKIPGFRTKKEEEGILFIEKKEFRLSTTPEVKEIQLFRGRAR